MQEIPVQAGLYATNTYPMPTPLKIVKNYYYVELLKNALQIHCLLLSSSTQIASKDI